MQIGINTELLAELQQKLQGHRSDFESLVANIGTDIDTLPEAWEGDAADAYVEQWYELRNNTLNQVEELLDTIGIQVGEVLEAMEDLDGTIAGQLRR